MNTITAEEANLSIEVITLIGNLFKDNLPLLFGVLIFVIIVVININKLLSSLFKFLYNQIFKNSEYIEFGKFKIKNRLKPASDTTKQQIPRMIDISSFVNMIDVLLSNEIENVITKTIEITNAIHFIEDNFNNNIDTIFRTNFATIRNMYHTEFIKYICDKTKFAIDKIHSTREYFFIDELLNETEKTWLETSKDITERNGFVDISQTPAKAKAYIDELNDCITRAIDIRKLECTVITKEDIDNIVREISANCYPALEKMFIRIGNLKKAMLDKRAQKIKVIETDVKTSVSRVISDVEHKFLCINRTIPSETDKKDNKNDESDIE